jgi:hypothetical protein
LAFVERWRFIAESITVNREKKFINWKKSTETAALQQEVEDRAPESCERGRGIFRYELILVSDTFYLWCKKSLAKVNVMTRR